jgi:Na+-driven multidrug efflux pump
MATRAENAHAKFLSGSLMRHISVMAFTSSVGLMAVFMVDFIDMIFISMLGKAELAAAVGYAGAIFVFHIILWHRHVDRGGRAGRAILG